MWYRLNMSVTMSNSASAAAIFCALVGWGAPPKPNIDILMVVLGVRLWWREAGMTGEVSEVEFWWMGLCGVGGKLIDCGLRRIFVAGGCKICFINFCSELNSVLSFPHHNSTNGYQHQYLCTLR